MIEAGGYTKEEALRLLEELRELNNLESRKHCKETINIIYTYNKTIIEAIDPIICRFFINFFKRKILWFRDLIIEFQAKENLYQRLKKGNLVIPKKIKKEFLFYLNKE